MLEILAAYKENLLHI